MSARTRPKGCRRRAGALAYCAILTGFGLFAAVPSSFGQQPQPAHAPNTENPNQAFDSLERGQSELGQRHYAAAEAWFRKAISASPKLSEAHHGLGIALWNEGKSSEALRELTEAAGLRPDSAALHLDLARAAWTLAGRAQAVGEAGAELQADSYRQIAIEQFQRALSLNPKDLASRLDLAELELESRRPKDAVEQAQEVTREDPSNASAFLVLGRADLAQGNDFQAASEFERSIQLNPHSGEGYLALGELRARERSYHEAAQALRGAIRASPHLAAAYSELAQILEIMHQDGEALTVLEQAAALNPSDWESAYQLGKLEAASGRDDDAMKLFEKALAVHGDFPEAREQLALGLVRRRDLAGAETQANTIIARHPDAAEGHRVMSLILWKQRRYDASLAECALALQANPQSAAALAVQVLDFWQEGRRNDARQALIALSKLEPHIGSAEVFCRLALCDASDAGVVADFLKKNAWVLAPPLGEP